MLAFHGTTLDNLHNLLSGGSKPSGAWNCSDQDGCFYVYPSDKIVDMNCIDGDELENIKFIGINDALGNAAITASLQMKTQKLVVLELDIPDEDLEDDFSCDNMSDCASLTYGFDKSWIKAIYTTEFKAMYSPFCIPDVDNVNLITLPEELELICSNLGENSWEVSSTIQEKLEENLTLDTQLMREVL